MPGSLSFRTQVIFAERLDIRYIFPSQAQYLFQHLSLSKVSLLGILLDSLILLEHKLLESRIATGLFVAYTQYLE